MNRFTYVIIGGSIAAVAAIEGIRSQDREGSLLVIGEEDHVAYGRPLISYYLLGETDLPRMDYRPGDFYEKNGVTLRLGVRATAIHPEEKTVELAGGEKIGYEKLLVATGSRPFEPPMEGIENVKERYHFMTMDDALALEKALSPEKRALIIGAGLIGLKCFEGIAARVKHTEIVDLASRILPSILDETGAKMVQSVLEEHGATFHLADSVAHFDEHRATLRSGKEVEFDILITAVGVRPNVELVKEAGGEVSRGIVIDAGGRTTLPDVYAAGDCTESLDVASGTKKILALLPNASFQGRIAGVNMAGGEERLTDAAAFNSIGFFGTHVMTAGVYEGEEYLERTETAYKALFLKDGVLKGFILIDHPERAGIYTMLLRKRIPLSEVDLKALEADPKWSALPEEMRRDFAREV